MWKRALPRISLLIGWYVIGLVSIATAAPPDREFLAAKQSFIKEMKKKAPSARTAAVTALAELSQPDAADLILKRGCSDDDAGVRQASRAALKKLADDRPVRQYLNDELKKAFRKHAISEQTIEIFRVLVVTDDESRQAEALKSLDEYLAHPVGNPLVAMALIDDLGIQGDAEAVHIIKVLARVKMFDSHFGYRRCVVQAMSQIRHPEAVDFLISFLPNTQGLIQYDVIQYLTRLTRQKFRDDDKKWAKWWQDNRKEFEFPAAGVVLPEVANDDQQPSYYGIPICAKRIVFVLDTSGSMRGQPIEAAKTALLKAIESLPESVAFDVVMFDVEANTWHPRLIPASYQAKQEASKAIYERGLKMGTASNAALNTAFHLEPEAIYFLSDGEPTDGTPAQIVNSITQFNRTRRISIHTIGVVTQRNGGAGLTMFMQPLSNKNYGTFRLVE